MLYIATQFPLNQSDTSFLKFGHFKERYNSTDTEAFLEKDLRHFLTGSVMPFIYLILLIITLIKWLLPYIIIGIVSHVMLVLLALLFKKIKKNKKRFLSRKNKNKFNKQPISSINSLTISQIIAGLLSHAIQQEKEENDKMLLNLQIRAREQAHILHNSGLFEEEIEFIKKEIESCNLNGSYYKYWVSLLKIRIAENEKQQESCMRSFLLSQIIAGLLNHVIQQAKRKEDFCGVNFEQDLSSTETQTTSDKISTVSNDMSEYPSNRNFLNSEIDNDNSIEKVPYWKHTYVYSADYLQTANQQQKQFYNYFKEEFLNGHYLDLEENLNYAFILMFDLVEDYKKHKDVDLLKSQLSILAENYPRTATYTSKTLLNAIITLNKEKSECALKFYDKSRGQLCRWVTPGNGVEVQGFKLMRGNFYIGECFLLPNNIIKINRDHWSGYKFSYIYGPVLIPNLPVANKEEQNCVFCSYQNMTPSTRYEYLMWLSGKKEPQDVPIEVLLFYLYGCEIRMFIDPETNSTERKIMVDNILQIYKSMVQSQHNFEQFLLDKFGDFVAYSVIKFFRTEIESFNIKSILKRNYTYRDCFISLLSTKNRK